MPSKGQLEHSIVALNAQIENLRAQCDRNYADFQRVNAELRQAQQGPQPPNETQAGMIHQAAEWFLSRVERNAAELEIKVGEHLGEYETLMTEAHAWRRLASMYSTYAARSDSEFSSVFRDDPPHA